MSPLSPRRSERGATATEYGLLVSFIAIAIVVGVTAFGQALDGLYTGLGDELKRLFALIP